MLDPREVCLRPPTTELMTLPELAESLRISKNTAYRMVEKRELAFHKVRGSLRFRKADVDVYLAQTRVESKEQWK
jgi:excisionase family DNA binding protein